MGLSHELFMDLRPASGVLMPQHDRELPSPPSAVEARVDTMATREPFVAPAISDLGGLEDLTYSLSGEL
jgi:hypothetical protein